MFRVYYFSNKRILIFEIINIIKLNAPILTKKKFASRNIYINANEKERETERNNDEKVVSHNKTVNLIAFESRVYKI